MRARLTELEGGFYRGIVKPVCFSFDPEDVHKTFIQTGKLLGSNPVTRKCTAAALSYKNRMLEQELMGVSFRNPVGLAAGFDKNADAAAIMGSVGFGFTEVGSITAKPCSGNKGVRLHRIPEMRSILVNMGLNNRGAVAIHSEMRGRDLGIPVVVSVAKTNCNETADPEVGLKDYFFTIKTFKDTADIFELNISCPNAFGGQDFADPDLFERLVRGVRKTGIKQPVLVKLSPDLSMRNVERLVEISARQGISGFVCSNLSKKHKMGRGGLSGKAVEKKANALLAQVYKRNLEYGKRFVLVGTGGIFSADDAYRKIRTGANLVELITGMIYQGPQLVGEINQGLVELLERDGFGSIGEATGIGTRR